MGIDALISCHELFLASSLNATFPKILHCVFDGSMLQAFMHGGEGDENRMCGMGKGWRLCNFPFRKRSLPIEMVDANIMFSPPSVTFLSKLYQSHQLETHSKSFTCFLSLTLVSTTDYLGSSNPNRNPNLTVPVAGFPPPLYPNLTTGRLITLILTFWLYECSEKIKHCRLKINAKKHFECKEKKIISPRIGTYRSLVVALATTRVLKA